MEKVALILEGGGFRGCYTAGAMTWLVEHNIEFPYCVSISATAIHSLYYVAKDVKNMHEISVNAIQDKHMKGIIPLFTEGELVGYEYMLEHYIMPSYKQTLEIVRNSDVDYEFGTFNVTKEELQYKNKYDLDENGQLIKASCVLPIAGKRTTVDGESYLDGGIDTMVATKRAHEKGYDKMLVIVTKDKNYVRKPNGFFTNLGLRLFYGKYKTMLNILDHRTEAYYDQMDSVYKLEEEKKAVLIRPSKDCGVGRFSGTDEQFNNLYNLGWQDMEDNKAAIFELLGIASE